ncbi:hypothetical protein QVD17_39143 [Tagetes erecta]|uniref:Serpin domain-containing protein n=1 Tax=Tagetes erecta TaxID=13708 RepID=A0AAD8JN20_TARER|nr:hypothetical protein QVD17_39143 [Tagetes erecta]
MAPIFHSSIFKNIKPMHNLFFIFFFFLFIHAKAGFNPFPPQHLINSQTSVSTTLATHLLSKKQPDSNVVFSPISIHVVLSMLAAGSKGPTHKQLLDFLKANTTDDLNSLYSLFVPFIFADYARNRGPQLSFANGVWADKTLSFKPSFKQVLDTNYEAACNEVDFQNKGVEVVNEVNSWAKKHTNGVIEQVLPVDALKKFTSLVFANAIYFKGVWSQKFNRAKTKESDFHLLDGNKVRVPFMTSKEEQFVERYDDFKVLGLPYLEGQDKRRFTMYIFLPHAKDGLRSLVKKISSTSDFFDRHIPCDESPVRKFLIPKFKISFGFEASDTLKELGLVLPFSEVDDFTEMVDLSVGEFFNVSGIHHKSFVEVNEEGTEAAAATIVLKEKLCMPVDFVADHPFLFIIREDMTRTLLFIGQVIDPSVPSVSPGLPDHVEL